MRTKIICELASSWNADLDLLKAMVKTVAEQGGDLCKLQDYRASNVPATDLDKARYEKYEMKDEYYPQFLEWCKEYNIEPLVTCFNADRVKFLSRLGLKRVKIASISMTNKELLLEAGANFEELIVSTAFHSKEEIEETIDWLATNAQKFVILHCVGNYPLDPKDANLYRIDELKKMTEGMEQASTGYSDHSLDLDVAKTAIAMGVSYVEKHFSLARELPQIPHSMYEGGPQITTHAVSIVPAELKELAEWRDKIAVIKGYLKCINCGNDTWKDSSTYSTMEDCKKCGFSTDVRKFNEVEGLIKSRYEKRYGV